MTKTEIKSIGLKKRKNGIYYARIRYKCGEEIREKLRSLKTRKRSVAAAKIQAERETVFNPLFKNNLADLLQEYLESCESRSRDNYLKTVSRYRVIFDEICPALKRNGRAGSSSAERYPPLSIRYIQDMSASLLERFFTNVLKVKPDSTTTANRYRESIRAFVNWAMNTKMVSMPNNINPICLIKRFKETVLPIVYLNKSQIARQLFALRGQVQLQTMVAVMIFAGLRRTELLLLQPKDICLERMVIFVQPKLLRRGIWLPKNGASRVVPISKRLAKYLRRYFKTTAHNKEWVFPRLDGNHWMRDQFSTHLRDSNAAKKLPWTCADYRRTFGSHLAIKGISLYKICKLMGNSIEICKKHYAALMPSQMHDDVEF